jgi:hypothetical protein
VDQYPAEIPISAELPSGLTLGSNQTSPYFPKGRHIPLIEWGDIVQKKRLLLFLGQVQYYDIFGGSHETRFCLDWDGNGFSPSPTDALNYYT